MKTQLKPLTVLFLGEGGLDGPAKYLAGILKWMGATMDHCGDQESIPAVSQDRPYDAILLSDYRHESFSPKTEKWLVDRVQAGTGLLMIGGWASFTGLVGGYKGTSIEELLPISCMIPDDRVNCPSGSVVTQGGDPLKLWSDLNLDWRHPPTVCGYHRAKVKTGAKVLLHLEDLDFSMGEVRLGNPHPLLAVQEKGLLRSGAFLTDCAPHWAGGLVDWGVRRVPVELSKDITIEVGDSYLQFFYRLISWIGKKI